MTATKVLTRRPHLNAPLHSHSPFFPRSYFCISTNLSKGEASVHQHGPVAKLVRASMTIVGMLPPVYHDGDLLVDGGYINNLPVDVMRGLGVESVIVVDVESKDESGALDWAAPADGSRLV